MSKIILVLGPFETQVETFFKTKIRAYDQAHVLIMLEVPWKGDRVKCYFIVVYLIELTNRGVFSRICEQKSDIWLEEYHAYCTATIMN